MMMKKEDKKKKTFLTYWNESVIFILNFSFLFSFSSIQTLDFYSIEE